MACATQKKESHKNKSFMAFHWLKLRLFLFFFPSVPSHPLGPYLHRAHTLRPSNDTTANGQTPISPIKQFELNYI